MVKQHDWVATLFFQPDKSLEDIVNLGITPDNASIKERDYYKEIPAIQEAFKTDEGRFDENKFNNFYQSALMLYNQVETDKLEKNILDTFEYDPVDIFAPIGSKERDVAARMVSYANPLRQSRGISSLTQLGDPTKSLREIGQENKVFNWDTQQFEDWTPNDLNLFSGVIGPSLVLAAWDEDGEHEVNGRIVKHKRGDLKFTEDGDTYYETLGGRSIEGKEQLHVSDILTVDGSKWNKYDFFDSDGLDKSVGGILMKTVATVGPMLIPGNIGAWYGGITAALELSKLFPVLWKTIHGIAAGDISNKESTKIANTVQAWASRFEGSTSDYGKNKLLGLETLSNIITSSSTQLMQQRLIAQLPLKFAGKDHISENAIKWGRALSLSYMAGTSSSETYSIFKEAGASDRMAGLGTLASIGAMYKLMNTNYFRDFWYEGTALSNKPIKDAIKAALPEVQGVFKTGTKEMSKQEAANWFLKTQDTIAKYLSKISKNSLVAGFQNEAIEETMEEISVDFIKGVAKGLNALGIIDSSVDYNFGFSLEEMATRYGMAFVGGGIGGVVFDLHNKWDQRRYSNTNKILEKKGFDEIIYLIRNGKSDQLRKELHKLHEKGKLGSTALSGSNYELVKDGDKTNIVYKEASSNDSQNDIIYRQILDVISKIETVLDEEKLNISDEQLTLARLSDETGKSENLDDDELRTILKTVIVDKNLNALHESQLTSRIFSDWNQLSQDILTTRAKIDSLLEMSETESKTPSDVEAHLKSVKLSDKYKTLNEKLKTLREKRDSIASGKQNDYYTGQILFALNPELNSQFGTSVGKHAFTKINYNKRYEDLTDAEKEIVDAEFNEYTKSKEKELVYKNYDLFWRMENLLHKDIKSTATTETEYNKLFDGGETEYSKQMSELLKEKARLLQEVQEEAMKETPDEAKIKSLTEAQIKNNRQINELENYLTSLRTIRALSEDSEKIWLRTETDILGDELMSEKASLEHEQSLLSEKLKDEKLDEKEKAETLSKISDLDVKLSELNKKYNTVFESRFINYSNWLDYLKDKGLYLDPSDPTFKNLLINLADVLEGNFKTEVIEWISKKVPGFEKTFSSLLQALRESNLDLLSYILEQLEDDSELLKTVITSPDHYAYLTGTFTSDKGSESLLNLINKMQSLQRPPVYELLEKYVSIFMPEANDIVSVFIEESLKLGSSKSVQDYVLQSESTLNNFKQFRNAIKLLRNIVRSNNENDIWGSVNDIRSKIGSALFETISESETNNLNNELTAILNTVESIIDIAEWSNSQKMTEQKKISLHMKQKFTELLLNNETSLIKEQIQKSFDVDLDDIIANCNFPEGKINDNNYQDYQTAVDKLETDLYVEVSKKGFTKEQIVDKIVEMFNYKNLIRPTSTVFTKDTEVITDYDQAVYLLSILTHPSRNFNLKYRELLSKPEYKKAPLYGQEHCVKLAYSFAQDPEMLNIFLLKIKKLIQDKESSESETSLAYLKSRSTLLNTLVVVLGAAGSGKTAGVSNILANLLDDYSIIVSAPETTQTDNLAKAVGREDVNKISGKELIRTILGRDLTEDDYFEVNGIFKLKSSVNIKKINLFDKSTKNIIFLDEIGLYTAPEIELLTRWAHKNNVLLFFAGDRKQNKRYITVDDEAKSTGIEDFIYLRTPELKVSLRPKNIAKADNLHEIQRVLDHIYDQYDENPEIGLITLSDILEKYFTSNPKIKLNYFTKDGQFEGGEKVIKTNEVKTELDSLLKRGLKVAIITDHPDQYTEYIDKVETIIDAKSVQGGEYDYVLIDKNFTRSSADGGIQSSFGQLSDLYTLTQRSTTGTLIVNRGLFGYVTNTEDNSKAGSIDSKNWDESVKQFKTFIGNSLAGIPNEKIDVVSRSPFKDAGETSVVVAENPTPTPTSTTPTTVPTVPATLTPTTVPAPSVERRMPTRVLTTAPDPKLLPKARITPGAKLSNKSNLGITGELTSMMWSDYQNVAAINNILQKNGFKTVLSEFNIDLADKDDRHKLQYFLAAYFMFGYYKEDPKRIKQIKNVFLGDDKIETLVDTISTVSSWNFKLVPCTLRDEERKSILCAELDGALIPIVITNTVINEVEDLKGTFELTGWSQRVNTKGNKFIELSKLPIILSKSQPYVLVSDKVDVVEKEVQENNDKFYDKNDGKTFIAISVDPFTTENDFNNYLTYKEDLSYTTSGDRRFVLAGTKKSAQTLKELLDVCLDSTRSDKNKHPILSRTTLAKILRSLDNSINKDVSNKVKRNLIRILSWNKNGINWEFQSEDFTLKFTVDKNNPTLLKVEKDGSLKTIKIDSENYVNEILQYLDFSSLGNLSLDNWRGETILKYLFEKPYGERIINKSSYQMDEALVDSVQALIENDFPGGYYFNDDVPFDAAINDQSVYHIISPERTTSGYQYLIDVENVLFPRMVFKRETKVETTPETKSETNVEELDPISDVEKNIIDFYQKSGKNVSKIDTFVDDDSWDSQLISVTLNDGTVEWIVYHDNGEVVNTDANVVNTMNALFTLKSNFSPVSREYELMESFIKCVCGQNVLETVIDAAIDVIITNLSAEEVYELVTNAENIRPTKECSI